MSQAYELYKDDMEILALSPMDSNMNVSAFKESYNIPFPMISGDFTVPNAFDVMYYPTSIYIDRYGVICAVETGGVVELAPFVNAFEHFTADNYQQKLFWGGLDL